MKQALRRILNFLDHNNNHKIRLEDFIDIMDEHNVEFDPEEVADYSLDLHTNYCMRIITQKSKQRYPPA